MGKNLDSEDILYLKRIKSSQLDVKIIHPNWSSDYTSKWYEHEPEAVMLREIT